MSEFKSYKEGWKKIDEIGGGGQGTTLKVSLQSDNTTSGVAKILSKQSDPDRRKRMHREATNLSTLDHNGLPKVLDTNSHHYGDMDYKLFIVTEFIPGPTLSQVDFSKISLQEKIILFKRILEILKYCHHLGILHRDIKPDNIILRDGKVGDPVILDFGLSFNFNDNDDDGLTPSGEHLGNRFLILPEQKTGEAGKRDFKSDISCAIGLFFFFLTGIQPTIPIDEHSRKPHQRDEAKEILKSIPDHQLSRINNIFDVGFEMIIGKRWQSIESVLEQLTILEMSKPRENLSEKDLIDLIKQKASKQEYVDREFIFSLYNDVNKHAGMVLEDIRRELGKGWGSIQSGGIDRNKEIYNNRLAPNNTIIGFSGETRVHAFITGNELVIQTIEGKIIEETCRMPLEGEKNWEAFRDRLKAHYLLEIEKYLGSG
jgi:eukaryotic-like serine/threonine-protein kinase